MSKDKKKTGGRAACRASVGQARKSTLGPWCPWCLSPRVPHKKAAILLIVVMIAILLIVVIIAILLIVVIIAILLIVVLIAIRVLNPPQGASARVALPEGPLMVPTYGIILSTYHV